MQKSITSKLQTMCCRKKKIKKGGKKGNRGTQILTNGTQGSFITEKLTIALESWCGIVTWIMFKHG